MKTKQFDAIIIGFGKGGKTLAADLANRGQKVAVVERSEKMFGGTCINIGCIPTKTLVHLAKEAEMRSMSDINMKRTFYKNAIQKKIEVTAALRQKNYDNLAKNPNISIFTGEGKFMAKDTVIVENGEESAVLQAERIFVNTGAESIIPKIEGIDGNALVFTSTSLMEMEELPARLAIVGGGYIGLEFASMYASFGAEVTVLEGGDILIPREDRDIAEAVRLKLEKRGVKFIFNANVKSITHNKKTANVYFENRETGEAQNIEAEAVLLATGRRPATAMLNLEAAGIKTDERGAIIVDEHLRTSNPNVYALGDVKGGLQFTYISLDDYRIVRDDLFGEKNRTVNDRTPVSYSVFIDPPLARIGMNEDEAAKAGANFIVKKIAVAAIPRAKTLGETDGILKAVIDKDNGQILGCTLFCPEAGEIINTVAVAIKLQQPAKFLGNFIFTHPSMSEALNDLFG